MDKPAADPADPTGKPAEPAIVVAAKPELPVTARGRYSLRVLVSRSERIIVDYVRKLQQRLLAWVKRPDLPAGDKWYRAMVGQSSTRAEAKVILKDLKQRKELAGAFIRDWWAENSRQRDDLTMYARTNEEHKQE